MCFFPGARVVRGVISHGRRRGSCARRTSRRGTSEGKSLFLEGSQFKLRRVDNMEEEERPKWFPTTAGHIDDREHQPSTTELNQWSVFACRFSIKIHT